MMRYYPYATGELTPTRMKKGAFSVDYVLVRVGPEVHMEASGSEDFSLEQGVATRMYTCMQIGDEFDQALSSPLPP